MAKLQIVWASGHTTDVEADGTAFDPETPGFIRLVTSAEESLQTVAWINLAKVLGVFRLKGDS